ncbi:MAG TPA: transglycosylase domain-containing protein [Solirubrobacteraceae bacterium]|nr:transglycosylase domain-containing protein [Solirubrobacteraceae bacterium]
MKRLRFLSILLAVLLLGLISFVFGMFMAVASDLPSLDNRAEFDNARNSILLDDQGRQLGVLSRQNQILVTPSQIPPVVKEAVIAIEDKRFASNPGIDIRGIARAFLQDVLHKGTVQGASTIEQQFVKNALQAQTHRTLFEKLREAALAYQLAHKWSKEKIITEYLNTIYFGNGAYGIEAAARTYFGSDVNHLGCGTPGHKLCVEGLEPWEAALLAGVIRSPAFYDPVTKPAAARARRNLVLAQMLQQGYLRRTDYEASLSQALPAPKDVQPPHQTLVEGVDAGYFTSWVQQQIIERYGATRAFDGGLRIETTLDLDLQRAAEQAVRGYLPGPSGPTAALVAIENSTGEVRAMVGGRSYNESPFNLATEGERQPGSSFKAFDLAAALQDGISPESVWSSHLKIFTVPGTGGKEKFVVHNDEGSYTGSNTLTGATAFSDNSIYAEVGIKVGTHRIAHLAHLMGITTPISTNPAMTIGGLNVGVTPLDMAHAYETIAHSGERVSGSLASAFQPVGIQEVDAGGRTLPDGHHRDRNDVLTKRVLPPGVATTETSMLETVLAYGTARAAAIGQFAAGKTGTTSNFGDAWFVGWNGKYTVAVWVGYPDRLVPMTTEFGGKPVFGGTFPALIWHDFMLAALQVEHNRANHLAPATSAAEGSAGAQLERSTSGEATGAQAPSGGKHASGAGEAQGGAPVTHGSGEPAGGGPGAEQTPAAPTPTVATPSPATPAPASPSSGASPTSKSGTGAGATGGVSPGG